MHSSVNRIKDKQQIIEQTSNCDELLDLSEEAKKKLNILSEQQSLK